MTKILGKAIYIKIEGVTFEEIVILFVLASHQRNGK
jgi:hypothetical protein